MPFFLSVWRKERAADFKNGDAFCAGANVSFENGKQTGEQARPQSDMIFAQRISQLDCAFAESRRACAESISRCALRKVRARSGALAQTIPDRARDRPRSKA